MLLTGDARGDKIIENLEEHGLMDDEGKIHVDLLKMPHHGSDRNVEDDFFKRVTADHYVVSGDGRHHNPELETYRMLFKARQGGDPYVIHVTYPPEELVADYPKEELEDLLDEAEAAGAKFRMRYPENGQDTMTIALAMMPTNVAVPHAPADAADRRCPRRQDHREPGGTWTDG